VGRGQAAFLYANGLGPVTNQPASGEPARVSPLSEIPAATPVAILIGGKQAQVIWAGLAPGFPGLYQVNVIVPVDIPAGNQPVTVSIAGKTSKTSYLVVE
jgi:adhesin/invasin